MDNTGSKLKVVKPAAEESIEQSLYAIRQKIYPRAVSGWFAGWRTTLVLLTQLVFYGTPWLVWNGRQAVLFDLVERKFYIFGLILWPQDFIFLTGLLVISALSLFLFTAIGGRLWCGFACPQTVYTEIFLWIERMVEGDRMRQMRLDKQPFGVRKLVLKSTKHTLWIALALWTGFTFVGYFTPIHVPLGEVKSMGLGPWETFWVLFYGFATYGNAGWMREQVCKYMCPYARFQGVMFDRDTLTVTYDAARGEPRGARSRSVDPKSKGLGDCVDCGICVQVCPTGIDIRRGLQYECIGCAACIDGCNQVMDKMGYPRGLIRYSTENAIAGTVPAEKIARRIFRPRVLVYGSVLGLIVTAWVVGLALRTPLKVNVIRDRAALVREVEDGRLENIYRLQVMNAEERPHAYRVSVTGAAPMEVVVDATVTVPSATTLVFPVRVRAPAETLKRGSNPIVFHLTAVEDGSIAVNEKSVFFAR
ncbi:MAG: cytochrome c oxidase accessory protein CcoG [Betaproteobacteria bacterium]|nr:MAG: cytochrome c oxidase accessory protein CcoG [Betaproteobacteria bacterium]